MLLDLSAEFYSWVRGALGILFVYHLIIFIQNRNRVYLFYSLYLLSFLIYFCKDVTAPEYQVIYIYLNFTIQFLGYAAYVSFGRVLLETKRYIPDWDILLRGETLILLGFSVVFILVQIVFGYRYQEKLLLMIAPIFTIFSLLTYIVLTKIKGKHVTYFIIGSLSYISLANLSLLGPYSLGEDYFIDKGINPMFFTYFGAMIETSMFAMILGYKIHKVEQEKRASEQQLQLKTKEMADLKMTVLQTQMDPHFLYNSLNSINNFVLQNDREKASDYITKFARLIREILKNSANLTIPLEDELSILSLYTKLEQMRMPGGFDYVVTIDETLDLTDIQVPPLLMQPFVENAIWHGFSDKREDKRITLNIYDEDDKIRCEIIDNGVGIRSKVHTVKNNENRKPFGLKASEDRIKLLHENKNVYVIIEDISEAYTTGTKVTIKFPKKI
ncbi:MAG: histidine kinase [Flavobacteriaceae bacterium]|nr:histidine kinase [Flavobacteriaceae bacterium]MCB0474200.1 histidine kinase [Flavobacteriaceae bacterium]